MYVCVVLRFVLTMLEPQTPKQRALAAADGDLASPVHTCVDCSVHSREATRTHTVAARVGCDSCAVRYACSV